MQCTINLYYKIYFKQKPFFIESNKKIEPNSGWTVAQLRIIWYKIVGVQIHTSWS